MKIEVEYYLKREIKPRMKIVLNGKKLYEKILPAHSLSRQVLTFLPRLS
jgi:hypothetical protein